MARKLQYVGDVYGGLEEIRDMEIQAFVFEVNGQEITANTQK